LTKEEVIQVVAVLDLRERLIAKLAIFAGMRPGEIFGLQWRAVHEGSTDVRQRVYKGKVDTPKTTRSFWTVAFSPGVIADMKDWKALSLDPGPDAWVFPSERLTTPLSKDNCWQRNLAPRLRTVGLGWANFQVMRRTHSSLSRKAGVDPKVVADQLGHGIGVNLDTYTVTDLEQRIEAVRKLESNVVLM